jgi:hypothetical protein
MTLTNARKAELRWELIDAAFERIETFHDRGEPLSEEEEDYLRRAIRRAARELNVSNHIYL